MAFADVVTRILTLRRVVKALETIAQQQTEQTQLLRRLADHVAPAAPVVEKADLKGSGPSFVSLEEQGRIQDFTERAWRDAGREPTEEEVERFLEGEDVRL
jgi:hypothetical protein